MPLDTRIPLGVTPMDPNAFTNALAAGMKMRETQNASARLAAKDEAAVADKKSLSNYLSNPRTPEADQTLARANPDGYLKATAALSKADNEASQAKNNHLAWAKANHDVLVQATGAMAANPTRANVTAILDEVERQSKGAADMSVPRQQLASGPDEAIPGWIEGWAGDAMTLRKAALAEKPKQHYDSYNNRFVTAPTTGGPQAGPEPAPTTAPVSAGGGSSGIEDIFLDENGNELPSAHPARATSEGPAPYTKETPSTSYNFHGKGDYEKALALDNAQGGGAVPPTDVPVPPAPVDAPPPADAPPAGQTPPPAPPSPPPGGFKSRAELDAYNAQRQAHRDAVEAARYKDEQANKGPKVYKTPTGQRTLKDPRNPDLGFNDPIPGSAKAGADGPLAHLSTAQAKEYQKISVEQGRFETALKQYRALVNTSGTTGLPGPLQAQLDNAYQAVQDQARILSGMGAPQAGEMVLLTKRLIPPTEILRNLADGTGAYDLTGSINGQLDQTEALLNAGKQTVNDVYLRGKTMEPTGQNPPNTPAAPSPTVIAQPERPAPTPVKVAPVEDLADMPMPGGKYTGQWAKDPSSGIVYRSDGKNWNKWTPPVKQPAPARQ